MSGPGDNGIWGIMVAAVRKTGETPKRGFVVQRVIDVLGLKGEGADKAAAVLEVAKTIWLGIFDAAEYTASNIPPGVELHDGTMDDTRKPFVRRPEVNRLIKGVKKAARDRLHRFFVDIASYCRGGEWGGRPSPKEQAPSARASKEGEDSLR